MDSPAFFVLLFVHLTSLIMAFGAAMVTDYFGLRWMCHRLPFARLVGVAAATEKLIWIGWTGLVVSGIPLIVMKGEIDQLMVIKLFCVGLAGLNGVALHRMLRSLRPHQDTDSVPSLLIFRLGLSLIVSQIAWWGAVIIGFLHRHIWSVIEWPPMPWLWIALFSGLILALWGGGEVYLRSRPSRIKVASTVEADHVERGPGPTIDPLGKEEQDAETEHRSPRRERERR